MHIIHFIEGDKNVFGGAAQALRMQWLRLLLWLHVLHGLVDFKMKLLIEIKRVCIPVTVGMDRPVDPG